MKARAVKKVQIAIDKMIDLKQDLLLDDPGDVERILDRLRELENRVESGSVKNGRLKLG